MKEFVCIVCPNSCLLSVEVNGNEISVEGNLCKRGISFAEKEIFNPERVICSTVKTTYNDFIRLPVKTDAPIPKKLIFDIMAEINKIIIDYPAKTGDILIQNILNTEVNIVATSSIK